MSKAHIGTSRPDFFRAWKPDGSHAQVHMAQKWLGQGKPTQSVCGIPTADMRSLGGTLFRDALTVLCPTCGDSLDRFANQTDKDTQ